MQQFSETLFYFANEPIVFRVFPPHFSSPSWNLTLQLLHHSFIVQLVTRLQLNFVLFPQKKHYKLISRDCQTSSSSLLTLIKLSLYFLVDLDNFLSFFSLFAEDEPFVAAIRLVRGLPADFRVQLQDFRVPMQKDQRLHIYGSGLRRKGRLRGQIGWTGRMHTWVSRLHFMNLNGRCGFVWTLNFSLWNVPL